MCLFSCERGRGRALSGVALLVLFLAVLVAGCGRKPPERFWEPTKADSEAITAVVDTLKPFFQTGLEELAMTFMDTVLPGTTASLLRGEMQGNPFKQRFRCDSFQHVFSDSTYKFAYTYIGYADTMKDPPETTCTVTFVETIPGVFRLHLDSIAEYLRDSAITGVKNYMTGFVVGPSGTILKTMDGGATWATLGSGTSADLRAVCFPLDYLTGYAVGDFGTILKTTDGGVSWRSLYSGTGANLYAVSFPNNRHTGWAVGDNGTILKTTDGGENWVAQTSPAAVTLRAVHFPATLRGGFGVGDLGTIIKTTNGSTWTKVAQSPFSGEQSGFSPGEVAWYGAPWPSISFHSVFFLPDGRTGYAVGDRGAIVKSADGGQTWNFLRSGTAAALLSVHFPTAATGYAVGEGGTVLKTENGGLAWTSRNSGTSATLQSVCFPEDAKTGYAVGDWGTIVTTTSGGDTWSTVSSGSSRDLEFVNFGAERETLVMLPLHADTFSGHSEVIEKPITATSINGCVLKKDAGMWKLWKLAGGSRVYAPNADDAPYILRMYYKWGPGTIDTVSLRPDTLHFGIQRLFDLDSLPTFSRGDSMWIDDKDPLKPLTNIGDAADYLYLVREPMGGDTVKFWQRYSWRQKVKFDSLVPLGRYRLFLEHIPATVFWEMGGKYTATSWGIPIVVK